MAEHQGFMLLYTETWGRGGVGMLQFLAPLEDHDKLMARARKHVGEHNPIDGLSTKVTMTLHDGVHRVSRDTSFGPRVATIASLPILRE